MIWQPIETGPKDGTHVLLYYPDLKYPFHVGHFVDAQTLEYGQITRETRYWHSEVFAWGITTQKHNPTHWARLPEPPAQETENGRD